MPYHLEHTKLRVVHRFIQQERNKAALSNARFIILEHVLPTTEEFVAHLQGAGAEIFALLGKPYSINPGVAERIEAKGISIIRKSYRDLDETNFLQELLADAVRASMDDSKQIIVLEVGGYFARAFADLPADHAQFIAGVVEDTTFGHNRYLERTGDISCPVFSVARSPLKEVEARYVGRDAVAAIDWLLRESGVSIVGRRALVIGYGMIGSNVARALRTHDVHVSVYDKHEHRNLTAFVDGFETGKKARLVSEADAIFAATADCALWAISPNERVDDVLLEHCKDGAILASVGSRDTEFDIKGLRDQAVKEDRTGEFWTSYTLSNSKKLWVVKDGTAVNFILPSLPVEILDLVFAEMLICVMMLLKRAERYPPGQLYSLPGTYLNDISGDWLRMIRAD